MSEVVIDMGWFSTTGVHWDETEQQCYPCEKGEHCHHSRSWCTCMCLPFILSL